METGQTPTGGGMGAATQRLLIAVAVIGVLAFVQFKFNIIKGKASKEAAVPTAVDLPTEATTSTPKLNDIQQMNLPTSTASTKSGKTVRINVWAWNAQMGLMYANGGPKTTQGSLMEKYGVRLNLIRQDDTTKSQADQIKFAQRLHDGDTNPGDGTHFVIIMGDGSASYLAGINKALDKLGKDYRAEIVGAVGYSGNEKAGEDAFMGLPAWKDDANAAKGALIAGVLRDGDWNIAMYWAQQNGIKNNPDETTWDADALNWVSTDDYVKAAEAYINGYCEDRKVVVNGKMTGEKVNKCVNAVVTWTPEDVAVAKKKGGLVKLLSTRENAFQMPAVVIGIHKWDVANAKTVENMLQAALEGGDQVKSFPTALQAGAKASYNVYAEESAAYWLKYYNGAIEKDKTGIPVALGGSRANNLGDNLVLFGLTDGGSLEASMFNATYTGFGNISKQQYPKLVPEFPPVTEAVNTQFLQALASSQVKVSKPDLPTFDTDTTTPITDVTAKRTWDIKFVTGSAAFTPEAQTTLTDLYNTLSLSRLNVDVDGYTDNTGQRTTNDALSQARADAVAVYLRTKSSTLFPEGRLRAQGHGSADPVATNDTNEGRAKNRRVTITIGSK